MRLNTLTSGTGGYLLLSGPLSPGIDEYFLLTKYFLQILAGVTNNSIVTDPSGYIAPGMKLRIPFVLNETDIDTTVILLTDLPSQVLNFVIETPAGDLMNPAQAGAIGAVFAVGTNMSYYRFTLPLPLAGRPARAVRGTPCWRSTTSCSSDSRTTRIRLPARYRPRWRTVCDTA